MEQNSVRFYCENSFQLRIEEGHQKMTMLSMKFIGGSDRYGICCLRRKIMKRLLIYRPINVII